MKKLMISACLTGINCRYDGGNTQLKNLDKLKEHFELIPVCPETLAGLPCPRHPLEIVNDRVFSNHHEDFTAEFHHGADLALKRWEEEGRPLVLLQSRSPSCGKGLIYDGTFTGRKIPGHGVFVQKLLDHGAEIYSELELNELLKKEKA